MFISSLLRLSLIFFLTIISACAGTSTQFLGHSNEIENTPTPTGFTISPSDAMVIRRLNDGPRIFVDEVYHDGENYYICNNTIGFKSSQPLKTGRVINGQTGEIYNRKTKSWEPDPRIEKHTQVNQTGAAATGLNKGS
ncbi:hypothetical protein [Gimesia aquarii]|uniref:Uncharacterized protein n=1 Tax=Gimesia aquarii TaxID=2527964 RepID=A0A517VR10_9PLAN|nr:hypothetical protein [Gimesia aquarii]QDT95380.1 hypothetical protein V144x_08220 [Gimesia aquarii]